MLQATHNNIVESIFKWVPTNYLALGQFLSSPNICWLYCSIYSKVTSNNCLCKRRIMAVGPLILLLPISYSQQYSKNVLGPIKHGKRIPFFCVRWEIFFTDMLLFEIYEICGMPFLRGTLKYISSHP